MAAGVPGAVQNNMPPNSRWINDDGSPTDQFFQFLTALWYRSGGSVSPSVKSTGAVGVTVVAQQSEQTAALIQESSLLGFLGALGPDEPKAVVMPDMNSALTQAEMFALALAPDDPIPEKSGLSAEVLGFLSTDDAPSDGSKVVPAVLAALSEGDVPKPAFEILGLLTDGDAPARVPMEVLGLLTDGDASGACCTNPLVMAMMGEEDAPSLVLPYIRFGPNPLTFYNNHGVAVATLDTSGNFTCNGTIS